MPRKKKADETTASVSANVTAKEKAKTTAEKKTSAKKPVCKTSVCVEMSGLSASVNDIQNAVKKAVKERGLEATELNIYINAAEQAAYYTVNGEGGEDFKVDLRSL